MAILTTNWTQDLFFYITLLLLGLYFYLTRNFNQWKKIGVKYLPPSILFGNIRECILGKQTAYDFLQDVYKIGEGEKLIGFYAMDRPYLMVREPELLRRVFVKDFHNFSNRLMAGYKNDVLGSFNVFLINNPPWKQLRQKLTPLFTTGRLKKMFHLFMEINEDFQIYCDKLDIDDKIGKPVDVKETCASLTTDFIGISAYGMKFNSLLNPKAEFRRYGRAMFKSTYLRHLETLAIFFVPALRPLTNPKFFGDGSDFIMDTFHYVIKERIKSRQKRDDLVDALIQMNESQIDGAYKLNLDQLIAQAAIFFSAGFETSSTTMSFALYELAKNQEIQNKLREEILTAMEKAGGKLTYEWVTSIPYLHMVINETMRLYPVLAWVDRIADNDYTFPGTNVTIQKNTALVLPMKGLQTDPKYWPNPQIFDPDRFSDENKNNIVPFTFFPFGLGPRNCIGERLGYLQAKLGLINFISRFTITPCEQTPKTITFDPLRVFTYTRGGLYLNFRKLAK
ncbi:cytochrome P450 6k1-like [Phymastichus coffea]|uniref:cytochrome P450 6k1-like n=1 Tax=Phymastichus coffea TaxID=108790 RepID=UPI00273C7FE4|nr:cytochrome P450 6k1-like [Phymastichus coffea]